MPKDEKLFDVRILGKNIKEGLVTKKEYEKFIKNLPDVEEKGERLIIEEEEEAEETETEITELTEEGSEIE